VEVSHWKSFRKWVTPMVNFLLLCSCLCLQMMPVMSSALAKAAAAKAAAEQQAAMAAAAGKVAAKKEKEKQQLVPRAMPSRHARAAAAEQIRKTGTAISAKQKEMLARAVAAAAPPGVEEDEKGEAWSLPPEGQQ